MPLPSSALLSWANMSQPEQPRWIWDPDSRQYYYYDARSDHLIFANGVRAPRPQHIPRTAYTSAAAQAAATPSPSDYATNPVTQNPNYVTGPSNQQYSPQSPRVGPATRPAPLQQAYQNPTRRSNTQVNALAEDIANITVTTQQPQIGASRPQHNPGPVTPQVTVQNGVRYVAAQDPSTQVRTVIQTAPVDAITDPSLLQDGIYATRRLMGTDNEVAEQLFDSFRRRETPRKFFTVGKVFLVLWVEPAGESNTLVTNLEPGTSFGRFGERVFSKVRRFVVVREGENYCSALPIASYGHQGVGKRGVKKSEHSIIYTSKVPPDPLPAELPERGDQGMRPQPIRVDTDDPSDKLDGVSRLDYGKVHTIQHNIKVKSFGKVNPKSMNALIHQFGNVWSSLPAIRQPGSSKGASDGSPAIVDTRDVRPPGRRPSRSTKSGTSGGSRPEMRPAETEENRALRAQARDFIQRLVDRGYTEEQATRVLHEEVAKRRDAASTQEESDEEDDEDEEDESSDEESQPDPRVGSKNKDRTQAPQSAPGQPRSRSTMSSQTQQRISSQAQTTSSSTSASSTQQPSVRTPAVSQYSTSTQPSGQPQSQYRTTGTSSSSQAHVQAQSRSAGASSSSHRQSQMQGQTQPHAPLSGRARAEAMMTTLLQQGKSREEALEIIRSRLGSSQGS